ncbi:hypothetical protein CDG62_13595 [Acinetobacter sp. WCHA55]|nr:hypothetical protein CDG62_13595 [Acinetobacter sp. WCHA55]
MVHQKPTLEVTECGVSMNLLVLEKLARIKLLNLKNPCLRKGFSFLKKLKFIKIRTSSYQYITA